jgi:hypothetical protein
VADQDKMSTVEKLDDGVTLKITGNAWKRIDFPLTITEDTILMFDFKSDVQGEIHAIGFDDNLVADGNSRFQLYGTQEDKGAQLNYISSYSSAAPQWQTIKIQVGYYFKKNPTFMNATGYMVFINDHDQADPPTATSYFRNIQIFEEDHIGVKSSINWSDVNGDLTPTPFGIDVVEIIKEVGPPKGLRILK